MSTFQAIIYAIVQAFAEILPVDPVAHHRILAYFTGWPEAPAFLIGAMQFGLFLSLLVYFRHDFLSLTSSFLQVAVYRKKPRAIDEQMPFFVMISAILPAIAWFVLRDQPALLEEDLLGLAIVLAVTGLPMWFLDSYTRKNKSFYDWNALDSFLIGLGGCLLFIPGAGRMAGAFSVSAFRNFSREGAAKFILYAATPVLGISAYSKLHGIDLHAVGGIDGTSWLTIYSTLGVAFLTGLFVISSFLKQIAKITLARYAIYRIVLAVSVGIVYWVRNR